MPGLLQTPAVVPIDQFPGRRKELQYLSGQLENFETSGSSVLLVEGPAGIGKTSLLQKALEDHKHAKCFKLYGKFDASENAPYQAFRQAFKDWANQILLLSDEELSELKESTTSAIQTNIPAITSVFKELEVFFSRKQHGLTTYKADSHQIKARFYYFFKKFLRSVTALNYHLIFFLDDLQWGDRASFQLLEDLSLREKIPGLLFVTAYRPLSTKTAFQAEKIQHLKNSGGNHFLKLGALSRETVESLVPRHWNFSAENRDAFTTYLLHETQGNPFKIKEILKAVQRDLLSTAHPEDNPDFWEHLPRFGSGKGSVEFIRQQLIKLPQDQLRLISVASCLGYYFKPELLQHTTIFSPAAIKKGLLKLKKQDLLIQKGNSFVFAHDTIFSASCSFMEKGEAAIVHQKAGAYLLSQMKNYDHPLFFKAVNHLNLAWKFSGSTASCPQDHLLLNLRAARLAVKTTALEMAQKYYSCAKELLESGNGAQIAIQNPILLTYFRSPVISRDDLQYHILFGFAETMFLLQKFEHALDYVRQVLDLRINRHQRVKATLVKVRICSALIYQKNIRHILLDGLHSLEQVLAEFGIVFPSDPAELLKEVAEDSTRLSVRAREHLYDQYLKKELSENEEYRDLLKLIATSGTFLYYMDVRKNMYMMIKALVMCMEKGFTPVSPILFSVSFMSSSFSEQNRSLAHALGKLSLKMIQKEPFRRYAHVIYYIGTLNFFAWENHYRTCINRLKESVQLAYELGDPHYASFCSTNIRLLNCYRGKNLQKHLKECLKPENGHHVFFISSSDNDLSRFLIGLKPGFAEGDFRFSEDLIRESEYNLSSRFHLNLALQKLYYISGNFDMALNAGEICENLENVYAGFQIELEHFFFYSLSLLQAAHKDLHLLEETIEKISPKLREFYRLSKFRSGNYYHKVLFIEAEIAKCKGKFKKATLLYDEAIEEAQFQGFIHHAAMAAERAFEYYLENGRHKIAKLYGNRSLKLYTKWGANAKAEQLRSRFPYLRRKEPAKELHALPAVPYEVITSIIRKSVPGQKLKLEELAGFLISKLVSRGNADSGCILILRNNNWTALASAGRKDPECFNNRLLCELREKLPVKVLNFAIKKGERQTWNDISKESLFIDDPYLQKEKPAGISTYPIRQGTETIGLIYLEEIRITSEEDKNLFYVIVELASTTFANAVYYENNEKLNQELKAQERKKIEATIESQEKERQRIARELHDSLGQMLALIKLNVSQIESRTEKEDPEKDQLIKRTSALLDESCDELRTISYNLMPPELDKKSIGAILEDLIRKNRTNKGPVYRYEISEITNELSIAVKFTLYRLLQEIIHNIIKHASATEVMIYLTQTGDLVNLLVEDNGKGFDKNLLNAGLGLKNIYSRVKLLNGFLDIDSSINNGTVFNVSIPLKP